MNHIRTIDIYSTIDDRVIQDVQLWLDNTEISIPKFKNCKICSCINHAKIPIYLIQCNSINVYTNEITTKDYFERNISKDIGVLCKVSEEVFIVFHYQNSLIKAMILNFNMLNKINKINLDSYPDDVLINMKPPKRTTITSRDLAIDQVLEKSKLKNNPFLTNSSPPSTSQVSNSVLSNQDQVNAAINKIISSGLRIRGLSSSLMNSLNDKLTIKEIHQMTFKSAIFTLRKHHYNFNNNRSRPAKQVTLNELQEIVENLLHLYVDVE
ncbi:unnamed protein product [Candida verbasci]|uniref:Mitochondrial morphogenesis protein SLD7 n=1 Tax=Candida verbasci TaxID=1227364 RepID=A0A9W4TTU4_9ASCO|nr:unnamed protein product [Candida verbasci]